MKRPQQCGFFFYILVPRMNRITISSNFFLDEFVCPEIYDHWGEDSRKFVDDRIVRVCQLLRDLTGKPVTVNNWATGGNYRESGLRTFTTATGARMSQHRFGRAADVKVRGMSPADVQAFILVREKEFMAAGLARMENVSFSPSWTHLDTAWTGKSFIEIVNP